MNSEPAVTTYLISEPFDKAYKSVRQALAQAGLSIVGGLDVSERMRRELRLGFSPCRILVVDSPYLLLEATALDRSGAALLPIHVVVSARGDSQTLVHWMDVSAIEPAKLPAGLAAPLSKLHSLLSRAIEQIALRQEFYPAVS
jgi:uncharacterized protein (DUF302 family)